MSARPELLDAIRLATLAPSGHNAQPWTFMMVEDGVAIFPDLTRRLPVVDPQDRELYVGLGCALENLCLGARHAGLKPTVEYFPAAHPSALMIHLGAGPAAGDDADLVGAIPERQSTRGPYERRPLPADHLAALERAAREDGVAVHLTTAQTQIDMLAGLVEHATLAQYRSPGFRAELSSWIRFNREEADEHADGLTYAAMGRAGAPRWLGATVLKTLISAKSEAKRAARLVRNAPTVMVFAPREDDKQHWVGVGRSFERVALTATALGIRHAHANMVCEVTETRHRLGSYLGLGLAEPLVVIRLGYAKVRPRAPRRPLDEVVVRRPVAAPAPTPARR
jgi:nitroreductase